MSVDQRGDVGGAPVDGQRDERGRDGLTLVEIVVAIAVLSVLVLGMFQTLNSAQRYDMLAREHQAASEAAFRELDFLMAYPTFDSIADITSAFHVAYKSSGGEVNMSPAPSSYFPLNTDNASTTSIDESLMAGHITTVRNPSIGSTALGDDIIQVNITVAWRGADGGSQRVDLVTMRAR